MKNILFLFIMLLLKTSIVSAQSPILSLDAEKGLSNTVWQDQSGNNNHITLSKPASKNADGVYFDGNNSAILSKALPLSNFTIYMTVKFETMGGTLLGNGQPSSYGLHYPNNVVYSATDKPAADFGTTALTTNKLMTLTLTRDVNKNGGNVTLFVNGEQIGVFQGSQKNTFNLTNLCGEMGYLFRGWMKRIEVYNSVPIVVPIDQPVDVIKIETAVKAKILVNKNILAQEIFDPRFLSSDLFSFKLFEVISKPSNGFPVCDFIAVGNVTAKYLGAVDTEDGRVYNYNITSPNMKLSSNKKYVLDVAPYYLKLTPKRGFQMSKPQKDCNGVIANGSVLKLGFSAVKIL